jgi:hypothetical protein
MTNLKPEEIKLAPPGAGLGFMTELFLKYYVNPFVTRKVTWEECEESFTKNHNRILDTLKNIPQESYETKVLVPPQKGLEDSSRFWSAKMVVEHLLIVGTQIQDAIIRLSHEEKIDRLVGTAEMKPKGDSNIQITLETFRKFAQEVPSQLNQNVKNKESRATLKHPWFGEFNSKQWYWVLGVHAGVHNKQLKAIIAGLK